jgi:hypothetical protein
MAGFAAFVLFFERPMDNAVFWIMLAAASRLALPEAERIAMLTPELPLTELQCQRHVKQLK